VATVEDGIAAQIRNIEASYGRPLSDWFAVIADSELTKHNDVVAMLKSVHGMAQGAAHRVSLQYRAVAEPPPTTIDASVDALYAGKKAVLRPLHDQLMAVIDALGGDVAIAPKKGYLSLRRKKQFAMIQPSGAGRLDVGLVLPGVEAAGRLESAAGFNALFTHRVRVATAADIDEQLTAWLHTAYARAG
jgi:hypothetical protein